jgi:hypothetical protein
MSSYSLSEEVRKEFETIKERVEYILSIDTQSRNSDKRLFSEYLKEFTSYALINKSALFNRIQHFKLRSFDLDQVKQDLKNLVLSSLRINPTDLPIFETIRRTRQKIQNEEERFIPTSEEVARRRNIREDLIREYIIKQKAREGAL